MSKCNIINNAAFYKLKAGQTVFHIQMDQFGQKKVVAKALPIKPVLSAVAKCLETSPLAYIGKGYWPLVYPKYLLFRTRRAAQRYLETATFDSEKVLNVVKRVRPKPIEAGDTVRLLLSTKYMDNSDPELAKFNMMPVLFRLD